jgi:hypothetical protein
MHDDRRIRNREAQKHVGTGGPGSGIRIHNTVNFSVAKDFSPLSHCQMIITSSTSLYLGLSTLWVSGSTEGWWVEPVSNDIKRVVVFTYSYTLIP